MRTLTKQVSVDLDGRARLWLARALCALLLACCLPVVAAAYTIVMRGGRRIEASANFVVTQTTLTYEAALGLNVTLPVAEIDIAATERANNEPPGSLLRRAQHSAATVRRTNTTTSRAPRTLTNRELEPLRRARLEREREAEARRRELGLPAVPTVEPRSQEEELQALREIAERHEAEQTQAESYWRAQAADLRAEMSALDAEIDYLRQGLAESRAQVSTSFVVGPTFTPFIAPRPSFPFAVPQGSIGTSGFSQSKLGGGLKFGGGRPSGRVFLNQRRDLFRGSATGARGIFAPSVAVFGVPFDYATADAATLRLRLADLEAARAALAARWQELEDDARRAGAQPGWLRE